jgi:protein-S-isoprenylcysteine O-methyltransferase Ste14
MDGRVVAGRDQGRTIVKPPSAATAVIGFTLYILLVPAILFITAGTADWPMAWMYVIMLLAATLGSRLIVLLRNPDLLRERSRFTRSEGTEPWDRILVFIVGLLGPMAIMVVAGLDHRFGWSGDVPEAVQVVAALALAGGYALAVWAMVVNEYFSAVARIQQDRGQVVVTSGPYGIVRHPAYAGSVVATVALPLMLSTLWALVPGVGMIIALVLRTYLEDAMLYAELDGYAVYAAKTRFRLLPGVW